MESLLCNAGFKAVIFAHGRPDYVTKQTIEMIIKRNNKAEL